MNQFYDYIGNKFSSFSTPWPEKGNLIKFTVDVGGKISDVTLADSTTQIKNQIIEAFGGMPNWLPTNQIESREPHYLSVLIGRFKISFDLNSKFKLNQFYSSFIKNAHLGNFKYEGVVFLNFKIDSSGNILNKKTWGMQGRIGKETEEKLLKAISTIPLGLIKELYQKTGFMDFILPVTLGIEKPYQHPKFYTGIDSNSVFFMQETKLPSA